MIRLTEVGREGSSVDVRIEGHLTDDALPVLGQELSAYREQGISEVILQANGLISISPRVATERQWPQQLQVRFSTDREALRRLLESYGLVAETG